MPRFYLLRHDASWSDAADYPSIPDSREEGEWIEGVPPETSHAYEHTSLNESLVKAFSGFIPKHQGKPYFTADVITSIWQTKIAVTDANIQDPSGNFGKAILSTLVLPQEMEVDRQALLNMFP